MDYKRLRDSLGKKGIKITDGRIHKKDANAIAKIMLAENEFEKKLRENEGGPKDVVDKAEKTSKEGHWLKRYVEIAKIVGSEWADEMETLQNVYDKFGSKPRGLQELAEELISNTVYKLVNDENWNKMNLERISWGLPQHVLEWYKLTRPTGTNERENV